MVKRYTGRTSEIRSYVLMDSFACGSRGETLLDHRRLSSRKHAERYFLQLPVLLLTRVVFAFVLSLRDRFVCTARNRRLASAILKCGCRSRAQSESLPVRAL